MALSGSVCFSITIVPVCSSLMKVHSTVSPASRSMETERVPGLIELPPSGSVQLRPVRA